MNNQKSFKRITSELNYGFKEVQIFNANGQLMIQIYSEGKYQNIDVSTYNNGFYLIKLIGNDNEEFTEKVIIVN